jgi:hypothetical protein
MHALLRRDRQKVMHGVSYVQRVQQDRNSADDVQHSHSPLLATALPVLRF